MSIKSDMWIKKMSNDNGMIEPFEVEQVRNGRISYGLSSYGYDIRVSDEYKIFTNVNNSIVDPKKFDDNSFIDYQGDVCIVPPNSFALARSVEYFRIPRNVLTLCVGKSTYARCGIIVNDLKKVGAKIVSNLDEVPLNSPILFRAHGTIDALWDEAKKKGNEYYRCDMPFSI